MSNKTSLADWLKDLDEALTEALKEKKEKKPEQTQDLGSIFDISEEDLEKYGPVKDSSDPLTDLKKNLLDLKFMFNSLSERITANNQNLEEKIKDLEYTVESYKTYVDKAVEKVQAKEPKEPVKDYGEFGTAGWYKKLKAVLEDFGIKPVVILDKKTETQGAVIIPITEDFNWEILNQSYTTIGASGN